MGLQSLWGAVERLSLTLLFIMLTASTAWAQTTENLGGYDFTVGTDSEGKYYVIDCPAALDALAAYVNGNYESVTSGKRFKVTKDITYSHKADNEDGAETENNYTAIGIYRNNDDDHRFRGTFDGQGHTISGIRIYKGGNSESDQGQGLFGYNGGTVKNVTLTDTRITGNHYTGGFVGRIDSESSTVSNCHVAADVAIRAVQSNTMYYGGIVGWNENGTISNCTSAATLTITGNGEFYGGIAGYNRDGTLSNNLAIGAVVPVASRYGGAICGKNNGGTLSHNYYFACTVAGVENATGVGCNGADDTNNNGAINASPGHFVQNSDGSYTINSTTGWEVFCLALQAADANSYFTGKTIYLSHDIEVSRMAGSSDKPFTGTFNGQGHTLTVNYGTAESRITGQYAAPFRYVNGGSIENLCVSGTIYTAAKYAAGLIAHTSGTTTISGCRSSVTIQSSVSGEGNHGGLVAATSGSSTLNIEGCLFDGSLLGTGTTHCGGFVADNSGTLNISNSLFAPASVTVSDTESATFARNWSGTPTNSYYTAAFGTAQGKAAHSITAGENVTVGHAGEATTYGVSHIAAYKATEASGSTDPFIAGLLYNNVLYAGADDAVSLTLSNNADDAPLGYHYPYTVSAGTIDLTPAPSPSGEGSYTLTMPDEDVTVSLGALRSDGQTVSASYIQADGTTGSHDAIALDETMTTLSAGWYFVGKDINYTQTVTIDGDVHLILTDGKTMTTSSDSYGINGSSGSSLTIYGQTLATGTLNATGTTIGINTEGTITINGGNVSASGSDYGINGNTTLSWTSADDRINVSKYGGTVSIAEGKAFTDGTHIYSGNNVTIPNNATLTPAYIINLPEGLTATGVLEQNGTTAYAQPDANVTLAVASGYLLNGAITYTPDGGSATATTEGNGNYCFTMPAANVIVNANIIEIISYIDAEGNTQQRTEYTILTGSETNLAGGWYVAKGTLDYSRMISLSGDVHLILKDGAVMRVGTEQSCVDYGIDGEENSFSIYAQSTGDSKGQLSVNATDFAISTKNITISGGQVTACGGTYGIVAGDNIIISGGQVTANGSDCGIYVYEGNITISGGQVTANGGTYGIQASGNGGQVTANGGTYGIQASGNVTLGWTSLSDFIQANSYFADGTVSIAEGKTFAVFDGDALTSYLPSGTIKSYKVSNLGGKSLRAVTSTTVSYLDADGTTGSHDAIALYGTETSLIAGWYVAEGTLNYSQGIELDGDVHLILKDGAVMRVGTEQSCVDYGIDGEENSFSIYAQSTGDSKGQLSVNATNKAICAKNITISGGQVTTNGGHYGIFGNAGNITISGGQVTANGDMLGIYAYAGNITLGWTSTTDFIQANSYFADGTVSIAEGKLFAVYDGETLTSYLPSGALSSQKVSTLDGKTLRPVTSIPSVSYLDAEGNTQQRTEYTILTGSETNLAGGWYVAKGTLDYSRMISLSGDVHLILKDGAVMRVGTEQSCVDYGIDGEENSFSIYAQSTGDSKGQLSVNATDFAISTKNITISGGQVTACGGTYGIVARSGSGNITISGGQVTANGSTYGIRASGNITLGWTSLSDFVQANSYNGSVSIAEGKVFAVYNGTTITSYLSGGALSSQKVSTLGGKSLRAVTSTTVSYLDADGTTGSHDAIALEGTETNLASGWYVADGTLNYSQSIKLDGDVHLILKDGAVMRVGTEQSRVDNYGINGDGHSFSIYAQSTGESKGQLSVNATNKAISTKNITISGGQVTANGSGYGIGAYDNVIISGGQVTANGSGYGIGANDNVIISGGQVTANGSDCGIYVYEGNITLGWTSTTDFVQANSYNSLYGSVSIADDKVFAVYDGESFTSYLTSGKLSRQKVSDLGGKTLRGVAGQFVTYLDAGGNTQVCTDYTTLTGGETNLAAGWYVAEGTLGYSQTIALSGDVHLILKDGAVMSVGTEQSRVDNYGINGDGHSFSICAQSTGDSKGQLSVNATNKAICAKNITISGGQVTANGGNDGIYANEGDVTISGGQVTTNGIQASGNVTLGWTSLSDFILANSYNGSVSIAEGKVFAVYNGTTITSYLSSGTLSSELVPDLGGKMLRAVVGLPVSYIDAEGNTQQCTDYTILTGSETNLDGGWYVANGDIDYSSCIIMDGDVHLILADGAKVNLSEAKPLEEVNDLTDVCSIYAYPANLTIYGQTEGTGTINAKGIVAVVEGNLTVNGGTLNATVAISIKAGAITTMGITINGGTIFAESPDFGIDADNITLGWSNASDRIYASSYRGTVKIADGKAFYNGYEVLSGTIGDLTKLNGKTLIGVDVLQDAATNDIVALATSLNGKQTNIALAGRTLYKDGDWNTLCLPFDVTIKESVLDGADVRALDNADLTNDVLTLNFTKEGAVSKIEAGKPYIIKWKEGENLVSPVFKGVTVKSGLTDFESSDGKVNFKGTYAPLSWTEETPSILFVGAKNTLNWPLDGAHLNAFRAYFELDPNAHAREFVMNFDGETTGISNTDRTDYTDKADAWYTVNGVRLSAKPTTKGMYIKNGKKVVIK